MNVGVVISITVKITVFIAILIDLLVNEPVFLLQGDIVRIEHNVVLYRKLIRNVSLISLINTEPFEYVIVYDFF